MKPLWRRRIAGFGFIATLILWPVSMFTFAKDEPPAILSLSWLALTLTAADIWATTDVRAEQDDKKQ
jgi:hypothetical protein